MIARRRILLGGLALAAAPQAVRGQPVVSITAAGTAEGGYPPALWSGSATVAAVVGKLVAVSALDDLFTIGGYAWVDSRGGDRTSLKPVEIPAADARDFIAQA